jgi:hypothetical protein
VVGDAARCFFTQALATAKVLPVKVTTDKAVAYPDILNKVAPAAWHCTQAYATDGSRPRAAKAAPAPDARSKNRSRSQKNHHRARLHPGHPSRPLRLGVDESVTLPVMTAVDELALAI